MFDALGLGLVASICLLSRASKRLPCLMRWLLRRFQSQTLRDLLTPGLLPLLEQIVPLLDYGANILRHLFGRLLILLLDAGPLRTGGH